MALIDRGRVMADYLANLGRKDSYKAKYEALSKSVDEAPAVDAVPVVHGRWIEYENGVIVCSECGEEHCWDEYRATYCEDCGAKMDGGAADA